MNQDHAHRVFGSATRTRVLIAIALLEQTYPRELAKIVESSLITVQRICADLELIGIIASRIIGKQRETRLNPRYFAAKELKAYLLQLQFAEPHLAMRIGEIRRRPRRTGKPL